MASIPCLARPIRLAAASSSSSAGASSRGKLASPFLPAGKGFGWCRRSELVAAVPRGGGGRGGCGGATCWFKFGSNGLDAEGAGTYGRASRDDFDRDDVEQYFNYSGMLAIEGTYDTMNALLDQNIPPVDILLMFAATEGDKPKIEELLGAGAKYDVKDADGRTALSRALNEEIRELILGFSVQNA